MLAHFIFFSLLRGIDARSISSGASSFLSLKNAHVSGREGTMEWIRSICGSSLWV